MNRVRMLIHFGVVPYMVFDGDYLPSKSSTEIDRASKREESRKLGLELHRLGKISQAHLELQKAVDVTPEMARQFIDELKKLNVQYLVAPYEADAQLAYLERKGIITGILSEDSDLLVFGARCLLTKLDQYGDCIEINRKDFTACREISLAGWSDAEFRLMSILSGCDYLANIDKMGLKTAYRLVRKYKTIEKILQMLAFDGKYRIPDGYLDSFRKAELTFLYQRVFCPLANDLVLTTSLGDRSEPKDFSFIGSDMDREIAIGVSRGDLNPITKNPIVLENTTKSTLKTPWSVSRPQSSSTFSDLKGNQSIQAFFKSKRTPLAELDPNSFSLSPSQQRLLQANQSWTSSSAPSITSLPRPNSALSSSTVPPTARTIFNRADEPSSLPQPLKRRRLCSETTAGKIFPEQGSEQGPEQTPEQVAEADLGRSRYFVSALPEPSPSVKNKRGTKREKVKEINIWSDDSVEDVMVELPDFLERHKQVERIKIFQDDNQDAVETSDPGQYEGSVQEDSLASKTSRASVESNTSVSSSATSLKSSSILVAKTIAQNVNAELKGLSEKFSYQPLSIGNALQARGTGKQNQGDQRSNRIATTIPQVHRGGITALQRIGRVALKRSQDSSGSIHDSSRLPTVAKVTVRDPETVQVPTLLHLTKADIPTSTGSEDLIIPDSENDSEDALSQSEAGAQNPKAPKLSLGRFAFSGQ